MIELTKHAWIQTYKLTKNWQIFITLDKLLSIWTFSVNFLSLWTIFYQISHFDSNMFLSIWPVFPCSDSNRICIVINIPSQYTHQLGLWPGQAGRLPVIVRHRPSGGGEGEERDREREREDRAQSWWNSQLWEDGGRGGRKDGSLLACGELGKQVGIVFASMECVIVLWNVLLKQLGARSKLVLTRACAHQLLLWWAYICEYVWGKEKKPVAVRREDSEERRNKQQSKMNQRS